MNHSYLEAARIGKASHWHYLAGTSLISFAILTGLIPVLALRPFFFPGVPLENIFNPDKTLSLPVQAAFLLGYIPFFIACLVVPAWVHKRPWFAVITVRDKINWQRIGLGLALWFLLSGLITFAGVLISPNDLQFSFDPNTFYVALLLSILLVPIQAAGEELFFRGYLMQWASLLSRNRLLLSLFSGIAFILVHYANLETIKYEAFGDVGS